MVLYDTDIIPGLHANSFIMTRLLQNSTRAQQMPLWGDQETESKRKVAMNPEWTEVKKQEQKTTKQQLMQKLYVNKLHSKLGHTGEDKIYTTAKHLHYTPK